MAESGKIIEGLMILKRYADAAGDVYFLQAEHDELFAGDAKLSDEDDAKLRALGFTRDDDEHEDESDALVTKGEGSWSVFT